MFIDSPSSKQRLVIAAPSLGRGLPRGAVGHDLDPDEQPAAADVADALVALPQLAKPGLQPAAGGGRAVGEPVARDDLEDPRPTAAGSGSDTWVV